ncbi:MAG: response regulator [Prevotella sp.]|nr:response regulator [Prevotella sp.]
MQSPDSPASCGVNCFDGHRFNNYKAQSHTPDIIITDYMMPVTDGMEMSRQLRTQEATNHIPIIMLSAKTDDESKIHGMETGIDDYMEKPFSADLLRARLNNIMARQENMWRYFHMTPTEWRKRT